MTKTKSTKRALLVSLLALLTCVSMLVGSTFAWFTDSVTSAGNIIKSGTLDVTMEWAQGKEDPATTTWTDASTGAIFNYDNWEPGYTEVRHVKIANEGTLALKYQLSIQANGTVSKLADVIDVYYIDPAVQVAGRTDLDAADKLGTLTQVLAAVDTTASGALLAGEELTVTIALKMQESAGNEYQDLSIGTDFSVVLMATQKDFEEDSFDETYDKGLAPLEDGDTLVEEDGIQYVYTAAGDSVLYLVTEDYTGDTVVVREGIKTIGNYAFAYNTNVKNVVLPSSVRSLGRGFDSSTVEKVVLNEGLEQIDSRAFRSTPNLKEVVIPSTVKTIADNAFQKSGIQEIVIPATVETIGETAFGSSKIEKVTFEGNTSIQGYAFRGCPNLRTVIMKGDNNEMIPSTLNGRNSTWFCNGESNNPNTSNIAFYVENGTVAARVRTALGAEKPETTPIYVGGQVIATAKNAAELNEAIAAGKLATLTEDINIGKIDLTNAVTNDVVIDAAGHKITTTDAYGIEVTAGKNITISNADVEMTKAGDYITYAAGLKIANGDYAGATITLKNCTITMANTDWAYAVNMPASVKNLNLVIDNCTLEGAIAVQCWGDNNTVTITNSKLICNYTTNAMYTSYCVVLQDDGTNMAENNTFVIDNCEFAYTGIDNFNSTIRAAADVGSANNTLTVTNCTYGAKVVAE